MTTLLGRIFHTGCERETRIERAVEGIGAGIVTGAGLVTVASIFFMGHLAIAAFFASLAAWSVGLIAAAPGWWALHRLGARCQQAAMIYGGVLTAVVMLLIVRLISHPPFLEPPVIALVAVVAAFGAIVGWVVAKVAYEPVKAS